jgi:hypothetical protein
MTHCVYSIPVNVGEAMLRKQADHWQRDSLRMGLLEKSKVAQHVYEEGHRVDWDYPRILEMEWQQP